MASLTHEMDVDGVCRGCMGTNFLLPMFQAEGDIPRKFFESTTIEVTEGDGLPSHLCVLCMQHVLQAHKFKEKCLQANSVLRSKLIELNTEEKPTVDMNKSQIKTDSLNSSDICSDDCADDKGADSDYVVVIKEESDGTKSVEAISVDNDNKNINYIACDICNETFSEHMFTVHMKMMHKNELAACRVCGKRFFNDFNRRRHELIHKKIQHLKCDLCEETFKRKHQLHNHILAHENLHYAPKQYDKELKCAECNKEFKTHHVLSHHIRYVHNDELIDFLCSDCGEVLHSRKAMYVHSNHHKRLKDEAERRFLCRICGKSCGSNAMLVAHKRVHTNERPFKCSTCMFRFKSPAHLKTHQLTHTQEKKFNCEKCHKQFALKGNLVVHMRIHTGERPYVCQICSMSFIDSKYLKNHTRDLHSEQISD